MKVRDVMVSDVKTCTPDTNLGIVAELFWMHGCGSVPVVDDGHVVGILTDRDVAIALGTRNTRAAETLVREVVRLRVYSCTPDQGIKEALQLMRAHAVRRLPVIDQGGTLRGILSLDDLVLRAQAARGDLTYADIVESMQAIFDLRSVQVV